MKPSLLAAAAAAGRASEAHLASGCTTCRPGARLAELCTDGQRAVTQAANTLAPGLLDDPCAHTSWEVTSEHRIAGGWRKARKCADCTEHLAPITEPEPHWPEAARPAVMLPGTTRTEPAPSGLARLAALMNSRRHWQDGRLVSEGTVTQAEIRAALGWGAPEPSGVTWEPGQLDDVRHVVRTIVAGPSAFPDLTDEYVIRTARRLLPELLQLVDVLHARVEELEGHGCRCYDPTTHVPGCIKAFVRWEGRNLPAAVWYRDGAGEWWVPVSVDSRGCLVLLLDGDTSNAPAALDELEGVYAPVTATAYGAHVPRGDLPERAGNPQLP